VTGWYAAFDDLALPPGKVGYAADGRRFLGSTFDPSGLYRFNAVRAMLSDAGLSTGKISNHVVALQKQFLKQDPLPNMHLLNPLDGRPHARFLAFKGESAAALYAALAERNIVTDVRGDVLRIGFGLYHDADDVDHLLRFLAQIQALE
jgi:selenocysteine lyase/cysteine desulfurase